MTKHSVFIKNPGDASWHHWGWFDTRRDAREESARQKEFKTKTRIMPTNTSDDFNAIAATMK
jgi:hypothetical protein